MKKDFWMITVKNTSLDEVIFYKPVTEEEAKEMYMRGEHADVLDSEVIDVEAVIGVE